MTDSAEENDMRLRVHPVLSLAASLAAVGIASVAGCGQWSGAVGKPVALCTIFAYYDAARAIAQGTSVEVILPLPANVSPHEFEASPADKVDAARTRLYVKNGLMLDDRFDKLVDRTGAVTLTIASKVPKDLLLQTEEVSLGTAPAAGHGHDHDHDHGTGNPHIWLDPMIQIKAAEAIRDGMIALAPGDKTTLEKNAADYIAEITQLDADFKAAAAGFKTKEFIGFHSAYDYLAHRYGLRQIASIEELPGEGLNPAQMQKIVGLIKARNIKYVAIETGLSDASMSRIKELTGVQTITLEPLETYNKKDDTYVSLMRRNLESLKTVLGN
jgi:zinc/manganese transport system substrate-binding protein